MELQRLTEELLRTLSSLGRAHLPQEIQGSLKGEGFLLSYLESHQGESTPGDLRMALGVSAPRTAAMLRALEEKGLLQRRVNGRDKRRVVVTMTEDGLRTAARRRKDLAEAIRHTLEQLGEQDTREFIRILGRIAEIECLQSPALPGAAVSLGMAKI